MEEKKNTSGEKWLVTFSDLMSLLFALFVLLISFAEVDAEKFKANSAKLANAFNKEEPTFNITQIKKDKKPKSAEIEEDTVEVKLDGFESNYILDVNKGHIIEYVGSVIKKQGKNNIQLDIDEDRVKISILSGYSFRSGSAILNPNVISSLKRISEVFKFADGIVEINGHTDSVPIKTTMFPSNWHLSSARASAVAEKFERVVRFNKLKLKAVGQADNYPVSQDNAKNRRVEVTFKIRSTPN